MKKIIKIFNKSVVKTIFKVQNKTNNKFNINSFNKFLITTISLLFFYLFYLLLPTLYDKTLVQTNIESKLLNEFRINLSTSADISYRILPAPHFLIKDTKVLIGEGERQKSIAEIKNFKVFLKLSNFLYKEKLNIKKIVINSGNFSLLRDDFKLLNKFKNKKFSNKEVKITNSNLFFKDNLGEIISIIKIDKSILFFDDEKLLNFLNLKGEAFNLPFTFNLNNHNDLTKFEKINLNLKSLRLNISNEFVEEKNKIINGNNSVSILNTTINTKYNIQKKLIIFKSDDSKHDNLQVDYSGEMSINPFDLNLNINLDNYKMSNLFNISPILIEFIKSGLLFNENISVNTSVLVNSIRKNNIFNNAEIYFHIINGKIDFNKTRFVNDSIGFLQLNNSDLFLKNNRLIFNGDIFIDVKNLDNLFSLLNTKKSLQKNFKNILINIDYDFFNNQIKFNTIKIDNIEVNKKLVTRINKFNINDINNPIKSRRLINKLLKIYVG